MDIVVCTKWVPETSEADLTIAGGGKDIERAQLPHAMNEWDDYALEEALLIKERLGGTVTMITVGPEGADEILRKALAMGADEAVHVWDNQFAGSDSFVIARILSVEIAKRKFDLILTGAQASDDGCAQVGGLLASVLSIPSVSLVNKMKIDNGKVLASREIEGGLSENLEVRLPALFTVQTGINEPRYVSMRGIRKVAGVDIEIKGLQEIGMKSDEVGLKGSRILLDGLFVPPAKKETVLVEGDAERCSIQLAKILKERGGIV